MLQNDIVSALAKPPCSDNPIQLHTTTSIKLVLLSQFSYGISKKRLHRHIDAHLNQVLVLKGIVKKHLSNRRVYWELTPRPVPPPQHTESARKPEPKISVVIVDYTNSGKHAHEIIKAHDKAVVIMHEGNIMKCIPNNAEQLVLRCDQCPVFYVIKLLTEYSHESCRDRYCHITVLAHHKKIDSLIEMGFGHPDIRINTTDSL